MRDISLPDSITRTDTNLQGLVIVCWKRKKKLVFSLYDMDAHRANLPAYALTQRGRLRIFTTRSGARGVRWKLVHDRLPHTTLEGDY